MEGNQIAFATKRGTSQAGRNVVWAYGPAALRESGIPKTEEAEVEMLRSAGDVIVEESRKGRKMNEHT